MQKVYVFGFAASFTDSLAFLTDVQVLDSAWVTPNGFLAERTFYSFQLDNYTREKCGLENPTTAIFFDVKRSKLEKKYLKVKRLHQRTNAANLTFLGLDKFRFRNEEHMEEPAPEPVAAPKPKAAGKESKKKTKKEDKK